jgi:hypothetical protein
MARRGHQDGRQLGAEEHFFYEPELCPCTPAKVKKPKVDKKRQDQLRQKGNVRGHSNPIPRLNARTYA